MGEGPARSPGHGAEEQRGGSGGSGKEGSMAHVLVWGAMAVGCDSGGGGGIAAPCIEP